MAKKENKSTSPPQVSKIPLPISDTPLVVDLPDGQKLVIGKLTSGSIIEVATWRGTGRPDSRTNRMMLGMSSSQVGISDDGSGSTETTPPKKLNRVQSFLLPVTSTVKKVSKGIAGKLKQIRVIPDIDQKPKQPVTTSVYDSEIKARIDDIVSKPVTVKASVPKSSPRKVVPKSNTVGNTAKLNVKKSKKGRI